jgi:sec-independent protein translocase protein TatA
LIPGIGLPEIIIVLVIVLVIFGPKRLPDLGRSLGNGMREFKDSVTGGNKDDDELPAGEKAEPVRAEKKAEPVRAEKSEATPAGGQSSQ